MKEESLIDKEVSSGSAAARKTYSAKELAEVYMTSREVFLGLNMEEVTRKWNLNFIYEFLYNIKEMSDIELAIQWLAETWADKHSLYDSYTNIKDPELIELHQRFVLSLKDIKDSLIRRFESETRKESLMTMMMMGYQSTKTDNSLLDELNRCNSDETNLPRFTDSIASAEPEYHISDLPKDVQEILMFSDDETYTLFVKNMREDTWLKIVSNKSKYLDRLRFVCNKFSITAKNTNRVQFDKLLHYIIPDLGEIGNLESAMKKQTDSNEAANYKNYDSPNFYHRNKCLELCKVGGELEECLTPVLEKLHHKRWNIKSTPR